MKIILRGILKPLSFLPALVMMYLIYGFSAQDGATSGNLSYKVSEIIVETANEAFELHWSAQEEAHYIERIHHPVRKLAHMTEYFLLAVSVSFPLYVYGVRGIWLLLLAGGFCVGFAALDEYHQSFVAGRGPSKRDVAIDSIGITVGVILVQLVCFIGRVTVFRPLAKKKKKKRT
ncbi:VanZ family protein [Candidatus Merdisoma sp. HCP28S3_D10]|uniref:VanZ family protein n=1 Tax=unclassified Candidatus Merdisoma TaxID=3099611 RepID=UPI003F8C2388